LTAGEGFRDRTVIITGAGKGLGRAYSRHLAGLGANVVVNNRRHSGENASSADQVVGEIRAAGGNAVAEYSPAEDPESGHRLLQCALDAFGRLDAVIANAGISEGRSFHKQSLAEFRQVIDINLMGTVHLLHPTFRYFYEQRRGCIIVSSSTAGLFGEHGLPAYSSSKAALLGLMYSLNLEGAPHGVRVNALAPYAVTQMTEQDMPKALKDRMQARYVAPVVAWLIHEACRVNGEIIITGGGRISRARMMESTVLDLPRNDGEFQSLGDLWEELAAGPLEKAYPGSLAQFRAFLSAR